MFKTQVEPRAAGEWFHYQVLDILWRHFMVYWLFVQEDNKVEIEINDFVQMEQ